MAQTLTRPGRAGKTLLALLAALACLCACARPARAAQPADVARRLATLGYVREDAEDLSAAVRNFQTANGLEATGTLDTDTLTILESDAAVSKPAYLHALAERYPAEPLVSGNVGEDVRELQEGLRALGYYNGEADGVFGDATRLAVMAFQTANGLYASGEADRAVRLRLLARQALTWDDFLAGKLCAKGDSGAGVRSLQRRLKHLGYYDGECTDNFGDATLRAVQRFQEDNGLPVSGEADMETCRLLYSSATDERDADGALREGSSGQAVRALQARLGELGYLDVPVNGVFDENTFAAVTLFQIANGFAPTGKADAELIEVMASQRVVPLSRSHGGAARFRGERNCADLGAGGRHGFGNAGAGVPRRRRSALPRLCLRALSLRPRRHRSVRSRARDRGGKLSPLRAGKRRRGRGGGSGIRHRRRRARALRAVPGRRAPGLS